MKNLKIYNFLFLILIAFACENEPLDEAIDTSSNTPANGELTVDFDGQTFVAEAAGGSVLDNLISIAGIKNNNQEVVQINIYGNSTGTYQLGVSEGIQFNSVSYTNQSTGTVWASLDEPGVSQGEVTITEIDQENLVISGTFEFTGHDIEGNTMPFTNGQFSVPYQDGLVNVGDNEFYALVDGEEFVEDAVTAAWTDEGGDEVISISAAKNNLQSIGLVLNSDITAGTYDIEGIGAIPSASYLASQAEVFYGDGSVTISLHDLENQRIVGEFEFVAESVMPGVGGHNITEGSFDVTY